MKLFNQRAYEFGLILVTSVFITACVSEAVKVDLPANHPANPQGKETAFIPPPNPFQDNIPRVGHKEDGNSSMTHEKHQPAHEHHMNPQTGHDSMPAQSSEGQNLQHRHKEHN